MKKAQLLKTMKKIVDKNVELYKSDFDIDKDYINSITEKNYHLIWIVRDCGTFIYMVHGGYVNPLHTIETVHDTMNVIGLYIITAHNDDYSLEKVTSDGITAFIDGFQKCNIKLHFDDGMTTPIELIARSENDVKSYIDSIPGATFSELQWL